MQRNGYLNIQDQLNLLSKKGIIVNRNQDYKILNKINYYTLMNYKNIFYEDGIIHKYKKNVFFKDFYTMYIIDNEIKLLLLKKFKIITNKISSKIIIDFCKNYGFLEKDYLNQNLYNNNFIKEYYEFLLRNNTEIIKYYNAHGFLPLWVILNNMDFSILVKYVLSFKANINKQIDLDNDILLYSLELYKTIFNNEKTYDFSKDNIKMIDLLKWFSDLDISVIDIYTKYNKMLEKIQCLTEKDIERVSGIKTGGKSGDE